MYNTQSWFCKTEVMSLCTVSGKKEMADLMCICIPGVNINTRQDFYVESHTWKYSPSLHTKYASSVASLSLIWHIRP